MRFSYLKRNVAIQQDDAVNFIFAASFSCLPLYFAQKGKHECEVVNNEVFIADIKKVVEDFVKDYDVVVYPESRFPFLDLVLVDVPNTVKLRKRDKAEICELASKNPAWRKLDQASAEAAWAEMGPTFTINKIKSNKRKDYVPYLFEKMEVSGNVLLLDDFIMSGHTIKAMAAAIDVPYSTFGIFYQK